MLQFPLVPPSLFFNDNTGTSSDFTPLVSLATEHPFSMMSTAAVDISHGKERAV